MINASAPSSEPAPNAGRTDRRAGILKALAALAARQGNAQLDAFSARLANALFAQSESDTRAYESRAAFRLAGLLKKNQYAFYHLASHRLEQTLIEAVHALLVQQAPKRQNQPPAADLDNLELTLVPYEEVEQQVSLANAARAHDERNSEALHALGKRLAYLVERDALSSSRNPFRPEIFLDVIVRAWDEFVPEQEDRLPVLPLLRPGLFLDLGAIYTSLNEHLGGQGIEAPAPMLRRPERASEPAQGNQGPAAAGPLTQRLERLDRLFGHPQAAPASAPFAAPGSGFFPGAPAAPAYPTGAAAGARAHPAATPGGAPLFHYLAELQRALRQRQDATGEQAAASAPRAQLNQVRQQFPAGALSHGEHTTIDLMTRVFDTVFENPHIPEDIKDLIGLLQLPVLRAALVEREFFFEQAHPARRMIEMLGRTSPGLDGARAHDDPLYRAIRDKIERVQQGSEQGSEIFAEVVAELEQVVEAEEAAAEEKLNAPIAVALKTEQHKVATRTAETEVASRLADGAVARFVEDFLERRWVPILAYAYMVQEEKPELVQSAIKTMDELVWSVKPKFTAEERKELIAKLPGLLSSLNRWIAMMEWDEAERAQFFADLADCHASIVRAPLTLSPQRQAELAVEAAKRAAERRAKQRAREESIPPADEHVQTVDTLERGVWLGFTESDGSLRKVKLGWVSPMRSLFIFSSRNKEEAFSLSSEALAQALREGRAQVLVVEHFVDRALDRALDGVGVNDRSADLALTA